MEFSEFDPFFYCREETLPTPGTRQTSTAPEASGNTDRPELTPQHDADSITRDSAKHETAWQQRLRDKYGLEPSAYGNRKPRNAPRWHDVADDDEYSTALFENLKATAREHDNWTMRLLTCGAYPPRTVGDPYYEPHETYTRQVRNA
jgi:hypothetical protein